MITFSKTSTKPNILFGKLPHYFKVNDTYKDGSGYGLLERYLEVFCNEVDNNISPYIDNIGLIVDSELLSNLPNTNKEDLLIHIADIFGNPPSIGSDEQYKVLLRHIWDIIQSKGTTKSLSLYLAIYGYKIYSINESGVSVERYDKLPTSAIYDGDTHYDDGFVFYSDYDLVITDLPGTGPKNPTSEWLDLLKEAITQFISPIFAQLNSLTYNT